MLYDRVIGCCDLVAVGNGGYKAKQRVCVHRGVGLCCSRKYIYVGEV